VAAFLDKEIAPYFDFDYMAKWVAGPGYARMNPEQRKALASRLEASFLGGLSAQLASYEGQQVRILRPRMGPRGAVVVNVGILRPGAYPAKMQFRMYKAPSGWKVYDVVANGRSVSSYYRVQFQRVGDL
jgi:phospholipid transport system substrate-binding protein